MKRDHVCEHVHMRLHYYICFHSLHLSLPYDPTFIFSLCFNYYHLKIHEEMQGKDEKPPEQR